MPMNFETIKNEKWKSELFILKIHCWYTFQQDVFLIFFVRIIKTMLFCHFWPKTLRAFISELSFWSCVLLKRDGRNDLSFNDHGNNRFINVTSKSFRTFQEGPKELQKTLLKTEIPKYECVIFLRNSMLYKWPCRERPSIKLCLEPQVKIILLMSDSEKGVRFYQHFPKGFFGTRYVKIASKFGKCMSEKLKLKLCSTISAWLLFKQSIAVHCALYVDCFVKLT